MRLVSLLAAITFLCACVTNDQLRPIGYEFRDDPVMGGFTVTYVNTSKRAMCLLPEHWPNQAGWINHGENIAALQVGLQQFTMRHFNTGYCFGGCASRVAPGEKEVAFVPYEHFGLPNQLWHAPKTLQFKPSAFPCSLDER